MQHTISSITQIVNFALEIPIPPPLNSGGYLASDLDDDATYISMGTTVKSEISVSRLSSLAIS